MMRTFKALGLALVAVFAMTAIASSAASAAQFHSTKANTTLTVASNESQKFVYETGGKTVVCTKVAGSGQTTAQTEADVTFAPEYSGCSVEGIAFSEAQVSMNSCTYTFTVTEEPVAGKEWAGPTHVVCPGTNQITITVKVFGVSVCTLHIGKQTPSSVSKYTNASTSQVKVEPNQTGIVGSRQGGSECGAASSTTGSYHGSVTVKGEETGTQTAVNVQVG